MVKNSQIMFIIRRNLFFLLHKHHQIMLIIRRLIEKFLGHPQIMKIIRRNLYFFRLIEKFRDIPKS